MLNRHGVTTKKRPVRSMLLLRREQPLRDKARRLRSSRSFRNPAHVVVSGDGAPQDFCRTPMSIDELRQLTRLYGEKIGQIIGPNLDVPAPDSTRTTLDGLDDGRMGEGERLPTRGGDREASGGGRIGRTPGGDGTGSRHQRRAGAPGVRHPAQGSLPTCVREG